METDLGSHIYRKVDMSTGVRYGSGHEDVGGLWLLLGVAADGVGIEEELKDESFWLCFSCMVNRVVSELRSPSDGERAPDIEGKRVTHETMSGCCANGWAPLGNIDNERTRTGDENLRAAMFVGRAGSRVDQ